MKIFHFGESMKSHINFDFRSKNKRIAQEAGIKAASESFQLGLKTKDFLFSWDDEPSKLPIILEGFTLYYGKIPKDVAALKKIAQEACLIEYSNLKESYGHLPIVNFTDDEIFASVYQSATHTVVQERKRNNFSAFLMNQGMSNLTSLQDIIAASYPIPELMKESTAKMEKIFADKHVDPLLQKRIAKEVENFWHSFNISAMNIR